MKRLERNEKRKRIALVLSPLNLQRLAPGLKRLTGPLCEFWQININLGERQLLQDLEAWKPDGVIAEADPEITELLISMGKPLVLAPSDLIVEGLGCVSIDEQGVGALAARHLAAAGYARMAYVGTDDPLEGTRREGFLEACGKLGMSCSMRVESSATGGAGSSFWQRPSRGFLKWLSELPLGTGIFASGDALARMLVDACERLELSIPERIGVITSGETSMLCDLVYPSISQVSIPWEEIGYEAGVLLGTMLETWPHGGRRIMVEPTGILSRESTYRIQTERGLAGQAISLMKSELSEYRKVDWLCSELKVDRRRLERAFEEKELKPPGAYWHDLRLARAMSLMESDPAKTVSELAYACGFASADRFAAQFKKAHGASPSVFRQRLRECF